MPCLFMGALRFTLLFMFTTNKLGQNSYHGTWYFVNGFSHHYGATLLMGQEFFSNGVGNRSDHWFWTSDGIQKLLPKSDRQTVWRRCFPKMQQAEDMLKDCWAMSKATSAISAEDHRVVRLTLHVCCLKKSFDTMDDIVKQFWARFERRITCTSCW